MAISLKDTRSTAALDAALSGANKLKIYDGTAPDDADGGLGQNATNNLLVECAISAASAVANQGSPQEAQATITVTDGTAVATGDASFFHITDSSNNIMLQGSVGVGGSFNLNVSNVTIPSGATFSVSSFVISLPELGS